jgi:hypothetical protein
VDCFRFRPRLISEQLEVPRVLLFSPHIPLANYCPSTTLTNKDRQTERNRDFQASQILPRSMQDRAPNKR